VKNCATNCLALAEMRVKLRKAQNTDEAPSIKIPINDYVGSNKNNHLLLKRIIKALR